MSDSDTIVLSGALTLAEVPDVWREYDARMHRNPPQRVDLAAVGQADSSALSLLLEWQAAARAKGGSLRFENPPRALTVIAGLTGVAGLLGWNVEKTA